MNSHPYTGNLTISSADDAYSGASPSPMIVTDLLVTAYEEPRVALMQFTDVQLAESMETPPPPLSPGNDIGPDVTNPSLGLMYNNPIEQQHSSEFRGDGSKSTMMNSLDATLEDDHSSEGDDSPSNTSNTTTTDTSEDFGNKDDKDQYGGTFIDKDEKAAVYIHPDDLGYIPWRFRCHKCGVSRPLAAQKRCLACQHPRCIKCRIVANDPRKWHHVENAGCRRR